MPETYLTGETCKFYCGDGASTEVFTSIGQLHSIDLPELGKEAVKRTPLGSTTHRYRPSKIKNAGELKIKVEYDPSNTLHDQMLTDALGASVTRNFKVGFDNGAAANWPGYAMPAWVKTAKTTGVEEDSDVFLEITLQLDGPVTKTTIATP